MDLETVWTEFIRNLLDSDEVSDVKRMKMAGIPFLYLSVQTDLLQKIQGLIEKAAVNAMKGKRLHSEMIYVRKDGNMYVYRCRFFVPQEKMFCCGNLCHDCIRFRN
jgi:hypothetical protein